MLMSQVQETLSRVPEEFLPAVNDYMVALIGRAKMADRLCGSLSGCADPQAAAREDQAFSLAMKEKYGK